MMISLFLYLSIEKRHNILYNIKRLNQIRKDWYYVSKLFYTKTT